MYNNLFDNSVESRAQFIFVMEEDVYIAGYEGSIAKVWENGVAITLSNVDSEASSIYVVKK